ncbi:MAG: sulfatase-like hydrolase/transferase [Oscillospiraceae bacterium]|nr:sulfatase-like hydrolase/transferase [Oscillospiraceae bacterium]
MPRNVIIIHADQHRADCIGCYGNRDVKTPHIDALAADGERHDNHFTVYPLCTPSRYSLLTGTYASRHLGTNNRCAVPPGIGTFASVLRADGYNTAAVGKMHFTPTCLDVGFDSLTLAEQDGPGRFEDDYHRYLLNLGLVDRTDIIDQFYTYRANAPDGYLESFGAAASDLPTEHHSTTWITERSLEKITAFAPGRGNLLMTGYIKPHHPFDPPGSYADMYDPGALSILPGWAEQLSETDRRKSNGYFNYDMLTEAALRRVMAMYYGTVSHIDDGVGQIVARLKEAGLYDDALVIYTSDHGEYMGWHHLLLKGNYMYEPEVRIPLIVKYPKSWNRRGTVDTLSSNIDIAKMICRVCEAEPSKSMDGRDISDMGGGREYVVCERMTGQWDYMVRTKTHKLLISGDAADLRLFDLANDPHELQNIAPDPANDALIGEMKEMLMNELVFRRGLYAHSNAKAPVTNGRTPEDTCAERKKRSHMTAELCDVKPTEIIWDY